MDIHGQRIGAHAAKGESGSRRGALMQGARIVARAPSARQRRSVGAACAISSSSPSVLRGGVSRPHLLEPSRRAPPVAAGSDEPGPLSPPADCAAFEPPWFPRFLRGRLWLQLLAGASSCLRQCFGPLAVCAIVGEGLVFLIHRISHRLTNAVAVAFLGVPSDLIFNPWWAVADYTVNAFLSPYNLTMLAFFALSLPAVFAVRSLAGALATLTLRQEADRRIEEGGSLMVWPRAPQGGTQAVGVDVDAQGAGEGQKGEKEGQDGGKGEGQSEGSGDVKDGSGKGWVAAVRASVSAVSAQWPSALPLWRRVAVVEALFTLHMLPLQALSLLVVTAPWTLPRMADIQLSQQVAVLEGAEGRAALKRSTEVVRGRRWGVILPVVLCLVTARLLEGANRLLQQNLVFAVERGVPELPIAVHVAFQAAVFVLQRAVDTLPFVTYRALAGREPGVVNVS